MRRLRVIWRGGNVSNPHFKTEILKFPRGKTLRIETMTSGTEKVEKICSFKALIVALLVASRK
jgi:hypothetical protein